MTRPVYASLPAHLRAAVESILGWPVSGACSAPGGWSPGVAARVRGPQGERAFVKAVSAHANPRAPDLHRAERTATALLPPELGSPRLRGSFDDGTWVALVLDEVDGRPPAVPWRAEQLGAALAALDGLGQVHAPRALPPATEVLAEPFTGWRTLAEQPPSDLSVWERRYLDRLAGLETQWTVAAEGERLLHLDVRSDNLLVTPDGTAVLVDWPWAARGAPVLDVVCFVPSAVLEGAGPSEHLLAATESGRTADSAAVTTLVAAFAGAMAAASRRPPPPGLDGLRSFQAQQGAVALRWLQERTRWR